jgi:hypothetical protein
MNIILSLIALVLFSIVHLLYNITMLFTGVKRRKWYTLIDKKAFNLAFNIDVFGNYQYKDLWNLLFSKKGYEFGVFGETISSCLGKKTLEKSLTTFGWVIATLINIIDVGKWKSGFKGQGFHCVSYIQTDKQIKNFIKK